LGHWRTLAMAQECFVYPQSGGEVGIASGLVPLSGTALLGF